MAERSRLDEIEARADAATSGPWTYYLPDQCCAETCAGPVHNADITRFDAEFIAHARTDVTDLVSVLREIEALHLDDGASDCITCGWESGWPCATMQAIGRLNGGA